MLRLLQRGRGKLRKACQPSGLSRIETECALRRLLLRLLAHGVRLHRHHSCQSGRKRHDGALSTAAGHSSGSSACSCSWAEAGSNNALEGTHHGTHERRCKRRGVRLSLCTCTGVTSAAVSRCCPSCAGETWCCSSIHAGTGSLSLQLLQQQAGDAAVAAASAVISPSAEAQP